MSNLLIRFFSSIILGPIILLLIYFGGLYFNILLLICFLLGTYEIKKLKNNKLKISILLLLIFFIISSYNIRSLDTGLELFCLILSITWLTDIGGFVFGKYIGGKKIKVISPNKTYVGFLGSLILAQFSFIILNYFNIKLFDSTPLTSLVFFLSSSFVIIGDLSFSYFKRLENLKDYSNLIPGHGGIFDRIDGLIFVTIFFNLLLQFI